jgi:transposase
VDRGKPGAHHHLVVDGGGAPLAGCSTPANVHEGTVLERLVAAIPPIRQPRGRPGRPRKRPDKRHADLGDDSRHNRALLRRRGSTPRIARKGSESRQHLGHYRWIVERAFAWLHRNRRLLVRFERRDDLHQAFFTLGCALVCWQLLTHAD